ncbi:MAG: tRNA pseudouridine(55) synthase TruB [Actinomycetota bacterium]
MSRNRADGPDGLVVIAKEAGWTSHDVVAKARGILKTRKIGHSGTLDPDATGVLLLGVGKMTRVLKYLTGLSKTYTCEIVLGAETTTLDDSGDVVATYDMSSVTFAQLKEASQQFVGDIMQVPPMVSAIKVDGKRLHELARQGIEVERKARPVTVYSFELQPTSDDNIVRATIHCSSGTYIRSLAADLGKAVGGGAHIRSLCRDSIGSFSLDQAVTLEQLKPEHLLTPAAAMRDWVQVIASDDDVVAVSHGRFLPIDDRFHGSGPWAVCDSTGRLLAMYEQKTDELAKPSVVISAADGR